MTLTDEEVGRIVELRGQGLSYNKISRETGHSPTTVRKYCRKEMVEETPRGGGGEEGEVPYDQIFEVFDNGGDATDAVRKGLADPETAEESFRKYAEMKGLDLTTLEDVNEMINDLYELAGPGVDTDDLLGHRRGNRIKSTLLNHIEKGTGQAWCDKCGEWAMPYYDDKWRCGNCNQRIWYG